MGILVYVIFALLVAPVGRKRRIGFWKTFMWSLLLTPFIGLFIALNSGQLNARGCTHCENDQNEAEFCGLCGKNEEGLTLEEVKAQA